MPTIYILDSIKILIFYYDHSPPHFHAIYNEFEELITIQDLETLRGEIPSRQKRKLMIWAHTNKEFLIVKWNDFNPENKL